MEKLERPVTLISFRHKVFAARVPMSIRAQDRNFRADIMGGMQTAFAQHVSGHRGRRSFYVHSGDDDAAFASHDPSKSFRPAHAPFPRLAGCDQDWIIWSDRG